MRTFYRKVIDHRKAIIIAFVLAAVVCAILSNFVGVNYDMKDYLPEDSHSTVSLNVMQVEFDGGIPNARVMVRDVTIPQALDYKEKLLTLPGVTDVMWLDDAADIMQPIGTMDTDVVETYYKDSVALFIVTISEDLRIESVDAISHCADKTKQENRSTAYKMAQAIPRPHKVGRCIENYGVFPKNSFRLVFLRKAASLLR